MSDIKRSTKASEKRPTKESASGTEGEQAIIGNVVCPNCQSKLTPLPAGSPLFDVQCERCVFRAQVKTVRLSPPKDQIFGAGWDVLEKTLKSGQLIPPLIVNFQWSDGTGKARQEVYFYPFLTTNNVRKRERKSGPLAGYKEFNYVGLKDAPKIRLI